MVSERLKDDRGVVIVLVAASLASLLVIAALVIDLGGARHVKAKDQNSADAIALAGAAKLDPTGGDNQAACTAAWNYMVTNSGVSATPAPSCLPFAGTCVAATTRDVSVTQGDFQVTFVNPVPNSDAFFTGQAAQSADGSACQRFGVRITHTWRYMLKSGSAAIETSALALFEHGPGDVNAPLVVLDPHGCQTLTVTGSSHVTTSTSTGAPGYVAIDSDGASCTSGNKVIVDATGSAQITAGAIAMWALTTGNTAKAYDPSDVGVNGAFNPAPIASSAPVGRTGVDWRYNCSSATACPGPGPSAIAQLVAADGSGTPAGFTRWSTSYSCHPSGDLIVPKGNWYVDCPGGLSTSSSITFRGGNIVSDGDFSVSGSDSLRINCDVTSAATACPSNPTSPSTVFFRNGGLNKSGSASVRMLETFAYLAAGGMSLSGGGTLDWTAPDDPSYAFDDLLFWNESSSAMTLTGGVDTTLEGIFFAPNAALSLTGNTSATGLGAQMFVKSASLTGSASLTLAPRADRVLQLGGAGSALIR